MPTQPIYTQNKEKKPLVSFIVTYYNEPTYMLKECVNSILALSLNESERQIIVVDDGSEVSPVNDLLELSPNIIYVRQPNQGPSQARNTGIELASGSFIQFVDGDDCLLTSAYEQCLDIVRYKDTDMVLFQSTDKTISKPITDAEGPMSGTEYMTHHNLRGSVCTFLFNKEILHDLRFPKGTFHEDEEFVPQIMLRAENLYTTNNKAYYYRKRENSTMHKTDKRWHIRRLADAEQVIYRLKERVDYLPVKERIAMDRRIAQLTMDHIYNVITLTHDETHLNHVLQRLSRRGLFPLPDKDYTTKYKYFRKMTSTAFGRKMLMMVLRVKKA
jgi:glycosyltransferase, group 2 family